MDLIRQAENVKKGLRMQPGYVGTTDSTIKWIDGAVAELEQLRTLVILGDFASLRPNCEEFKLAVAIKRSRRNSR